MTDRLLTAEEVAEILGVSPEWVYDAARERRLPCIRIGRIVRFRREAIEAWIIDQEQAA